MGCGWSSKEQKEKERQSKYQEEQALKALATLEEKTKLQKLLELETNITNCKDQQGKLKDQDLVFLIGKTGIGKSTTINYLAGKEIQKDGIEFRVTGESISEIGNTSDSHTHTIVSLHLIKSNLHICDGPGFDDTKGFEADLINSQLIIKTIQAANSASFVLFINPAELSVGRSESMKKLIDQLLKLFNGVPDFKKSIKLAFTYISKGEEKKKMDEMKQYLTKMKQTFAKDEQSTDFINWMKDCVESKKKNPQYLIIQPQEKKKIAKILQTIEEITPIQQDQLKNLKPTNLSDDAIAHLKNFLSECLKEMDITFEKSDFLQGLQFFKSLLIINSNLNYPAFTECYKDAVQKLTKLRDGSDFKEILKQFRSLKAFNKEQATQVIDLIQKTLWHSLIKEIVGCVEQGSQTGSFYSIEVNNIWSFLRKLEESIEQTDKLIEKYEQYQKLSYLSENLKFKVGIEDLEYFKQRYSLNTTEYEKPLNFQNILQSSKKIMRTFCQKNNDQIVSWLQSEQQDTQASAQLSNLEFCKTSGLYKNLNLRIQNRIELNEIADQLIQKIQKSTSLLKAINSKIIQELSHEDYTYFFESNQMSSYLFITFILAEKNTGTHFQYSSIQQQFTRMQTTLLQVITSCFEKGATIQRFESLIPYQQFMALLRNMDNAVWEQIDKSDLFLKYQKNIEMIFMNERQDFRDSFSKVKASADSIYKGELDQVPNEIINQFRKCIICLLSLENIIQQFPQSNTFSSEFNPICEEYREYIEGLENKINFDNLADVKSNLKTMQILLINYSENSKYSSQSIKTLQDKQKQFTGFITTMLLNLKRLISQQDKKIDSLDLTKNILSDYEKGLQNLAYYKLLLDNYETRIQEYILDIENQWEKKQKIINTLNKNSKEQFLNNEINVWQNMQQNVQTIQEFVKQGQNKLNSKLGTVYETISKYFNTKYQLDLAQIGNFMRAKEPHQIVPALDLLKSIFSGGYPQIAIFLKENVYSKLIIELNVLLKEKQVLIQKNNHNFAEVDKLQRAFNNFKEYLKSHLTENNILVLKMEETKIQAIKENMNMQLLNFISNDNFEEAKKLMTGIPQKEDNPIQELMNTKIEMFINDLKEETKDFKMSMQENIQQNIITILNNFDRAQNTFGACISNMDKQQIITILQRYTENLIQLLFDSLESQDKANDFFLTQTFLKSFLTQLDSLKDVELRMKDKKQVIDYLQTKFEQKLDNLNVSIKEDQKKIEQEDLLHYIKSVAELEEVITFLNYPDIAKTCKLGEKKQSMLKLTLEIVYQKTTLYIHSRFRFSETDTKNYLMIFSEQICKTFQKNEKELEIGINNYIKQEDQKIQTVIKNIESQDMQLILQEIKNNPTSNLVKDTIQITIFNMKEELTSNINKNNKNVIIKLVNKIEQMLNLYQTQDNFLYEKMTNFKKDIIQDILDKWKKLLLIVDLDSQSISEFVSLIVYFENINSWCQFKECLDQCSINHLISRIYYTIDLRVNDVKKSIEKLDYQEINNHYSTLLAIAKHSINYNGKKMNIFGIFDTYIRVYQDNLTDEQSQTYTKINKEFSQSQFSQLIRSLIQSKQNSITKVLNEQFENNQLETLVSTQLEFIEFCKEIYKMDQATLNFEKQQRFIFDWVEQQYEQVFKQAIEFYNSKKNQPKKIIEAMKKIQNIERHFGKHIVSVNNKCLSKEFEKTVEDQYNIMYGTTKETITKFSVVSNREQFVKSFIEIYSYASQFLEEIELKRRMREIIRKALQGQSIDVVKDIILFLNQSEQGQKLHEENDDLFKKWYIELYNEKTRDQNNFDYLKRSTKIKQADNDVQFSIEELQGQFDCYLKIYNDLNGNLTLTISELTGIIDLLVNEFLSNDSSFLEENQPLIWTKDQKQRLLKILAHVSAAWTLIDCEDKNQDGRRFVHTVQIVTIMRLLNVDTNQTSQLYNHIAQVRTGEGKSIALGITSTILALLGFKVNCCCYSKYLSERDYLSFLNFFIHFKIEKRIQYGTFFELTEMIINKPHDLRYLADNAIKDIKINLQDNIQNQREKSVLIIDEVDFFFGPTFLGNVYAVGYQYTNQDVVNLFTLIWKQKYSYLTLEKICLSYEYRQLFIRHPYLLPFEQIINNKVNQMIQDAKRMDKHCYLLRAKELGERIIGYKEIDGITFGTNKGYRTAFAYCQEYERRKITREQRNNKLCLNFNLGCFSYPLVTQNYSLILGVTGTLEHMSEYQIDAMKRLCSMTKQTITPSIYGKSKFQFNDSSDVHMTISLNEYHEIITNQIKNILNKNRSVLVFFSGKYNLFQYQQYLEKKLQGEKYELQILDEETNDKQLKINKAAQSRMITLSTKTFGRGTDFKCFDQKLLNNGGIHAIQTFFSDTLAEEVQIKGRVARNGDPGSYSMILLQSELYEAFKIDKIQIPRGNSFYQYLDGLRKIKQNSIDQKDSKKQEENIEIHQKSETLNNHLQMNGGFDDVSYLEIFKELSYFGDSKDIKVNNDNNNQNAYNEINQNNVRKDAKKDKFNNLEGDEFDLVQKDSLKDKSLIIGQFCDAFDCDLTSECENQLKTSLNKLGFKKYQVVTDEASFIEQINDYDQIWIISGSQFNNLSYNIESLFVTAVIQQLKQKKGLFLLSDNEPFFYHANKILEKLPIGFEEDAPVHMSLQGNDLGCNVLKRGAYNNTLQFGNHLITNSLDNIYEGTSICYPKIVNDKLIDSHEDFYDIEIIGTSKTNKPCIFVLNGNNKRGRIVFDCGFTKLILKNWDGTAGTEKYFQNCYAWLYFLDSEAPK